MNSTRTKRHEQEQTKKSNGPSSSPLLYSPRETSRFMSEEYMPFGIEQASSDDDGDDHDIENSIYGEHDEGDVSGSTTGVINQDSPVLKRIGAIPLAVIIFYAVSGGPFGVEPTVRAGGALYTLLGFIITPFIWSIPEALVTTELGLMYPENSGSVAWVEEAFGPKAGLFSGYMTWTSGATDNAIYPVLFLEYLLRMFSSPDDDGDGINDDDADQVNQMNGMLRFMILASTSIGLAYINYLGLDIVGNMSIFVCLVSMSPFVLLCILGIPKVHPSRWFQTPPSNYENTVSFDDDGLGGTTWLPIANLGGVLWRPFLNNLFWNLNSFDSAGCFVTEVRDPGRNFPHAMFMSVGLVCVVYFFPILITLGATASSQDEWGDGYFTSLANEIVGPWLGALTVFASGISNLAQFQAEMSSDAYQIMGMADRGHLPKIFSTRSPYGTPTYGILLGTVIIIIMSVSDFGALVEMLNFNYSISLLMEYAAFVKLRISRKDVHRPYRVPLSTLGCMVMLIPTCCLTLLVMALASYMTYIYCLVSILIGIVLYSLPKCNRKRRQTDYTDIVEEDGR